MAEGVRTAESVSESAKAHYARVREEPGLFEMSDEDAREHEELGLALLEMALALQPGELLDLDGYLSGKAQSEHRKRIAVQALPYVAHSLGLLQMEFFNDVCGVLPMAVVRVLVSGESEVQHNGQTLTTESVVVRYRRSNAAVESAR